MSNLPLKQTIVLGYPNSGKSKFLRSLSGQIFTPITKENKELNYLFVKKTFKRTRNKTINAILEYIKTHHILYLDEPFYYLLPFEEDIFKKILKRDYVIATHRTAYFLLSLPSIVLINKKGRVVDLKISELGKLIRKPSFKFFETDLINYAGFLNQFGDINLNQEVIDKIKNYDDFKNTRTTYLIRDFLIWFALHPGDFYKKAGEYKKTIQKFFIKNCRHVPRSYQRVINKCLGCFAFTQS